MPSKNILGKIKGDLEALVGSKIKLKANQGRKKILEAEGILERTYPNIFVVKLDDKSNTVQRVSYSYADLLTNSVQLTVMKKGRETKFKCANY